MLGYATIGTSDMDRATAFYDALLAEIGGKQLFGMDRIKFYGTSPDASMLALCIPYDQKPPSVTSGIRLGTNGLAIREMEPSDMVECVDLIDEILGALKQVSDREFELDPAFQASIEERVRAITRRRPITTYPAPLDF